VAGNARVAWSGDVLNDGCYLHAARRLETAFARRDGVAEIAALANEVIDQRISVAQRNDRSR
jgi:hypothetical protein